MSMDPYNPDSEAWEVSQHITAAAATRNLSRRLKEKGKEKMAAEQKTRNKGATCSLKEQRRGLKEIVNQRSPMITMLTASGRL